MICESFPGPYRLDTGAAIRYAGSKLTRQTRRVKRMAIEQLDDFHDAIPAFAIGQSPTCPAQQENSGVFPG